MSYLEKYKKYLKMKNYSKQTITHYISDLKLLKKSSNKNWKKIEKSDVVNFVDEQQKQAFNARTINRRLYAIKGFYEYLKEVLEVDIKNPVRSSQFIRSHSRRLPDTLSEEQIEKILSVISDIRDRTIFLLMVRCGLRVSEVAQLELGNINLFSKELRIIGKGNKERIVPLSQQVLDLLVECVKERPQNNAKFFWSKKNPSNPLKLNSIQRSLKRYGQKVAIDIHPHICRHTFARQLTEKGVDRVVLKDLMGHESIASTDKYGKLSDPFIKSSYFEAMQKILDKNLDKEI